MNRFRTNDEKDLLGLKNADVVQILTKKTPSLSNQQQSSLRLGDSS